MRVILVFSMPDSLSARFVWDWGNGFNVVERLLKTDFPNYDFGTGLYDFARFIYQMDHADWRPFHNLIEKDDIMIHVNYIKPADFIVSVSYRGVIEYTQCADITTGNGSFDYSDFVNKLKRVWCV